MADDLRTIAEAVRDYHNPTSAEAIVAAFALAVLRAADKRAGLVQLAGPLYVGELFGANEAFAIEVSAAIEQAGRG